MKLIHYTLKRLSIALILIATIWAYFFYINILDEIMDETNDTLENNKERIIRHIFDHDTIIEEARDLMNSYSIRRIPLEQAKNYKEHYFDSTRFYETEYEFDPIRVLKTAFRTPDGHSYELTVMISTLEQNDMIEAIIIWIVILYATLLLCILTITHLVVRKSLRPLHHLLHWLEQFTPGTATTPLKNPTHIKEFNQLNDTINQMASRSEELYQEQRQFIENASHELQTPLAICQNKLELLAEKEEHNEEILQEIDDIQRAIHWAVKLNKSLLLLSRIENHQFHDKKNITFNSLIKDRLDDLNDIYEYKTITIRVQESGTLIQEMNEQLASTLVNNLLKNIFLHAQEGSVATIALTAHSLQFSNTGDPDPLDQQRLFTRFYQSNSKKSESTGLGLAIVKSICTLYNIQISYRFDGSHHFLLQFDTR